MLVWQAHKGKIESMAFAPDGRLLATATGGTCNVHMWDPTSGKLARKPDTDAQGQKLTPVKSVAFARDAPLFAAGTYRRVTVWNTDTWEPVADTDHSVGFYEVAFGPGDTPTLAASESLEVRIWTDAGRAAKEYRAPDRKIDPGLGVASLQFSPDGTLLVTSTQYVAALWDAATGTRVRTFRESDTRAPNRGVVCFSPDGTRLAIASGRSVELWDVAGGEQPLRTIHAVQGRTPMVWALGWTGDGKVLMTAGADGFVRLWDENGRELRAFEWGIGKVYCCAFSPDGLTCAAGGEKGQVVVWDVDS